MQHLLGKACLGDTQRRDIHELLQPDLAAALSPDTGLFDATKRRAWAATRVLVHTADASLQPRRKCCAPLQVVGP